MYKLSGYFNLQNRVRLIGAVAYMCCGYNVGHLQHFNWLSGAAFLPWCVWGYLLMQKNFSIKTVIRAALLFYLFLSSAHPGLITGGFYFFVAVSLFLFFNSENKYPAGEKIKRFFISNALLLFVLLFVSAGLVVGYADILPWFSRSDKIVLAEGLKNPTSVQSWLSALFPLSTVENDSFFSTDISMRNIYFSLVLVLFLFVSIFRQSAWQKFFFYAGIAFLLLSSGGIFKTFAYKFIPFIGYVRLDGEFIIFSLLCFILVSAIQLDRFITEKKDFKRTISWAYYAFEIILFTGIVFGLYKTVDAKEGLLYSLNNITSANGISLKLKTLIDSISFYDAIWIQGIFQLLLLWGIKFCIREKRWNVLVKLVIADVVIATLLNLPFTGVGKASVAQVQHILNSSPKGIPFPKLQPVYLNDTLRPAENGLVGDWSFYNKQIGVAHEAAYPVALKNTKDYFKWVSVNPGITFINKDFLFSGTADIPRITAFNGSGIKFTISSAQDSGKIVYQQASYQHWFYYSGKEKKQVQQDLFGFISVPAIKGENTIEIKFEPTNVIIAMNVSFAAFCIMVLLLLLNPAFIRRSLFPS